MTKLTVTAPAENQSIKRAVATPANFSPLAGLAEAASQGIQAEQQGAAITRRREADKASKAASESNALANRSALDYALGPGNVESESDMLNYELDPNDFKRLRAGEAAVRQGVRSSNWLNAERSRVVDTLRSKGATDEDIVKAFKGIPGVEKSFFRDMGLEAALIETEQANITAAANDTKQIELAKSYGFTGSADYLAAEGRRISGAEMAQRNAMAAAELAARNSAVSKDEMTFVTGQAKDATITSIRARVGGSVNSLLAAVSAAWTGGQNKPEFETRMQRDLIPGLKANLPVLEKQITDELMLIPGISADDVRSNVTLLMGPLKQTVESLEQNTGRYVAIAQNLKARHNVEFAETLPVIAFLENQFGRQITEQFYQLNEPQIKALIMEQKLTDWSNPNATSTLMLKAGSILRGEMSMMGQPTEVIETALSATRNLAEVATRDINSLDSTSVSNVVNGLGQLGLAANRLSVGEGESAHFRIAEAMGRSSTWTSLEAMLTKPEHAQKAEATIQVIRSGATTGLRSLETLAKTKMPSGHTMSFNKSTGRYEVKGPKGRSVSAEAQAYRGFNMGVTSSSIGVEGKRWEDAANRYLSVLVATEKHGLEPIKGTALQIREFHALGTVPEGATKTKSARKTADELFEENFNRLNETLQRLPETLATRQQMEARIPINLDDKPFAPLIRDTAQRYDVPMNVITALLSVENAGLDPNARGPEIKSGTHVGDRAAGLFQIMGKTAQGLGIDRNSVEGNIEGGIKLLAENFRRTGNWRDAISMYHSGVPYDQAKNRTDGGMKTVDYVARILQRAGLEG